MAIAVLGRGAGSCSPLAGVALGGADNLPSSFPVGRDNGTVAVCCGACDADPNCLGWTLNLAMTPASCWLKASFPAHRGTGQHLVTSGIRPAPPPTKCTGRCPNILHLVADDMRPQLGTYGHGFMKTPHLDQLAATGLQFDFAYTQFAYCAPSRNSFMSGRRPERTRALNFLSTFRMAPGGAGWTTMPEFFKVHGYFTSSAGKIFHDRMDDPASWVYPSNQTAWVDCGPGDLRPPAGIGPNYCGVTNRSVRPYTDEDLALYEGLKRVDLAVASGLPWWVSIGVHRPHTNYRVPPGFYGTELYPPGAAIGGGAVPAAAEDPVKPPVHPDPPAGVPYMAGNWQGGDISDPAHGCPTCVIPANRSVEYRRWYYAAVSWADHSLGRALDKLEALGPAVAGNTITVFHSDHGYQLGELNEWSKKTDTELATHVPLLIRVPWKPRAVGQRTTIKAELVDLYRTLAGLAGLTAVAPAVQGSVQGTSLEAAFDSPGSPPPALQAKRAFSQIGRCDCGTYCPGGPVSSVSQSYCLCGNDGKSCGGLDSDGDPPAFAAAAAGPAKVQECGANACCKVALASGQYDFMGYTMRTTNRRFTAWVGFDKTTLRVDWNATAATELYDLTEDTGRDFDFAGYSLNLAIQPAHKDEVATLLAELQAEVTTWY